MLEAAAERCCAAAGQVGRLCEALEQQVRTSGITDLLRAQVLAQFMFVRCGQPPLERFNRNPETAPHVWGSDRVAAREQMKSFRIRVVRDIKQPEPEVHPTGAPATPPRGAKLGRVLCRPA
jgi:hypothetical protein